MKEKIIKYKLYIIAALVLIVALIVFSRDAEARPYAPVTTNTTNNYYDDGGGNNHGDDDYKKAVAAGFALSTGVFDYDNGWQGAVSAGYYDDESALGFQAYTRVDDIMVGGGIACDTDGDQCGGAISASFHF